MSEWELADENQEAPKPKPSNGPPGKECWHDWFFKWKKRSPVDEGTSRRSTDASSDPSRGGLEGGSLFEHRLNAGESGAFVYLRAIHGS